MTDPKTDIKPLSILKKSEIAQKADTAEARAEAKREAEAKGDTIRLVFDTEGTYPDGTKWERDATPEEQAEYESWAQ